MPNPRKPAALRQRGARTTDLGPLAAPAPGAVAPLPPAGLLKGTREVWAAFWRAPISEAVDLRADGQRLTRWITYVDEWARLARALRKGDNRLATGSQGQVVLSPLWAALAQVESALQKAEADLGLGPMPRLKLGVQTVDAHRTLQELHASLRDHPDDCPRDYGFRTFINAEGEEVIDLGADDDEAPVAEGAR